MLNIGNYNTENGRKRLVLIYVDKDDEFEFKPSALQLFEWEYMIEYMKWIGFCDIKLLNQFGDYYCLRFKIPETKKE